MRYIIYTAIVIVAIFATGQASHAGGNEYSLLDHCPNHRQENVFELMKPVTNISIVHVTSEDIESPLTELHSSSVFDMKINTVRKIYGEGLASERLVGYVIRKADSGYTDFLSSYNARYDLQSSPEFMAISVTRSEKYGYYKSNVEQSKCRPIPILIEDQKYLMVWNGDNIVSVEPFKSDDSYWFGFISSLLESNFFLKSNIEGGK